jgi:hypothetical protein
MAIYFHCVYELHYEELKMVYFNLAVKLRGFSLQANYTDRAIAAGQRS